ncbi:MAG: uL15 family ribosomal protein, partial [Candidatus Thorarchaeota archaeon]
KETSSMQKRKSKKIHKMRGRRAAGYGFSAGHRASGQRGGVGKAGSKKHHYIKTMIEDPDYFGKHGFKVPQKLQDDTVTINVGELELGAERLVADGFATKTGKKYTIDIGRLGIDKVLGRGRVNLKLNLVGVKDISAKAREKITRVGGTIDLSTE